MSVEELRKKIKKDVDVIPANRLEKLSKYVASLKKLTLAEMIEQGRADVRAGRMVNWRDVRKDV